MMKRRPVLLGVLAAWLAVFALAAPAKPSRPIPAVEHVVLISVDGLRPDLALRANMPTLRKMLTDGAYTFWAKTTEVSITLPSHTSMVTGVTPNKHGVTWNDDLPPGEKTYPRYPTVMEMAKDAGYTTAMVAGKSKFSALDKPGTLTYSFVPSRDVGVFDAGIIASRVEDLISSHPPDLLFIHLPDVDMAGHHDGWGSPGQIVAIERTDAALARIFAALDRAAIRQSTVVILSADHGGAGFTHGPDDTRSRHIPWIIAGPGVRHGYDLTRLADLNVRTEDSAATIAYLLGLPQQPYFDGMPVKAAFEGIKVN